MAWKDKYRQGTSLLVALLLLMALHFGTLMLYPPKGVQQGRELQKQPAKRMDNRPDRSTGGPEFMKPHAKTAAISKVPEVPDDTWNGKRLNRRIIGHAELLVDEE